MKTILNIFLMLLFFTVTTSFTSEISPVDDKDKPLYKAEIGASFDGMKSGYESTKTFRRWVQSQISYPDVALSNNISGDVLLRFVIDNRGKIKDIEVIDSPSELLSNEVIRVMKIAPKWTPARNKGKKVSVFSTVKIAFNIINDEVINFNKTNRESSPTKNGENKEYGKPDIAPSFRNHTEGYESMMAFRKWVQKRIIYPKSAIEKGIMGAVKIEFIIDKNGEIDNIKIISSPAPILTTEVIKAVKSAPAWKPAIKNGKAVPVNGSIRLVFRL